jgi:hypothetical protein
MCSVKIKVLDPTVSVFHARTEITRTAMESVTKLRERRVAKMSPLATPGMANIAGKKIPS